MNTMKKFLHEVVIFKQNEFGYNAVWKCKFPSLEIAYECYHNLIDHFTFEHEHLIIAMFMDDNLITMEEV